MRWLVLLVAVAAAGFAVSGCNVACQTYCDNLTDKVHGCIESGAMSWDQVGAGDAEEYWSDCHERFERTLVIARVEDRNAIYDWCTEASLAVAADPDCDEIELPDPLDLLNQDPTGDDDQQQTE